MMILENKNYEAIHSSTIRSLLKEKAKIIRDQTFRLTKPSKLQQDIKKRPKTENKMCIGNFTCLFNRVTNETKKQILNQKKKNKTKSIPFFNRQLKIEKINTKLESFNQTQNLHILTVRNKQMPNNSLQLHTSTNRKIKRKNDRLFKGKSLSRYLTESQEQQKQIIRKKLLTQGESNFSNNQDFKPIGNIGNYSIQGEISSYEYIRQPIENEDIEFLESIQRKGQFIKSENYQQLTQAQKQTFFRAMLEDRKHFTRRKRPFGHRAKKQESKSHQKFDPLGPWTNQY